MTSDKAVEKLDLNKSIFVDTNILVYSNIVSSPFNVQAVKWLNALTTQAVPIWVNRQILREYLIASMRYLKTSNSVPLENLLADLDYYETALHIADDTAQVTANLKSLLRQYPEAARKIHDLNIVASMQSVGVSRLLTNNEADFAQFSGFITVIPLSTTPNQ